MGDWLGCHQMPERSFHLNGVQFPLCARCTGVFLGQTLMVLLNLAGIQAPLVVDLALMLPMLVDWSLQYAGIRESTNRRRLITGLLAGAGYIAIVVSIAAVGMRRMFQPSR